MTSWELVWADDHFQMNEHPTLRVETMVEACPVFDVTSGRRFFFYSYTIPSTHFKLNLAVQNLVFFFLFSK